jgi:hypothetical protein
MFYLAKETGVTIHLPPIVCFRNEFATQSQNRLRPPLAEVTHHVQQLLMGEMIKIHLLT